MGHCKDTNSKKMKSFWRLPLKQSVLAIVFAIVDFKKRGQKRADSVS
jgi:hypothetical protein